MWLCLPRLWETACRKKGQRMMHHFAHKASESCEYGYESSLHLVAKEIISQSKTFLLPAVYVSFPNSQKRSELICEAKEIAIDRVELEQRYNDVIPDIVIYVGDKQLFVEIYVTHNIDDEKLAKLKVADISTIEIDLSKKEETVTRKELTELILGDSHEKAWKYNSLSQKYLQRFYQVSDKYDIIDRGLTLHIDGCPIRSRSWRGKAYANFYDDCLACKYCIAIKRNESILCSGRQRIASVNDFSIPEMQRIKDSNDEIEMEKNISFANGICPNCGGKLVERYSRFGGFWGCSNYPHCRFTASADPKTGEIIMKS